MKGRVGEIAGIVGLAVTYAVAARLGLMLDAVAGFATLVWAPSGIALAALVRFGPRLWPGVVLGAFVANALTGAPVPVAVGIAVGNTLEALAGAWALGRVRGFRGALDTVNSAVALIVLAAVVSTAVSATIGVASLYFGGIAHAAQLGETWRAWWVGDLIGDLVVAPVLLAWSTPRSLPDPPRRPLEALAVGAAVLAASAIVYEGPAEAETATSMFRYGYLFFPLLMWAALRLGQRETITTTLLVVALAIVGTALGRGPFVQASLHQSLFGLQTYVAVATATFLVLGASIAERRRTAFELEAAQKSLEEAVRARDALISVASHELRTPLSALQLHVQLVERNAARRPEKLGPFAALGDQFKAIDRQVRRLGRLIDSLLDVSRITAGKLHLEFDHVDLAATARDVVSRFDEEARRAGSTLTLRADAPVVGHWDSLRVEQIATNLISNALKYGDGNPIDITVESSSESGRLVVTDRGIGIAKIDQARIFERFERLSGTHASGFGLGLWIVREIVERLRGTIRVESAPGRGTTFVVELPKTRIGEAPAPITDPMPREQSRSRFPDRP
jgi:two-component system, NarL family, sensor histidine kinase FusK